MKALTILKRAAALMDNGRWHKGDWNQTERRINVRTGRRMTKGRQVVCYCAGGAIHIAGRGQSSEYAEAEQIFLKAIGHEDESAEKIWDWNDDKRRTVGQVRRAFHRAIRIAEKQAA